MMKWLEKHPFTMILIGIMGISCSAIFVRYSQGSSVVLAAYRLLWTVLLMSPFVFGNSRNRNELRLLDRRSILFSILSGIFLAFHFAWWFESLKHTSVASSSVIVCTEVIWVAIGFCMFLKGHLSIRAIAAIVITIIGSLLIAYADMGGTTRHLYGDFLAWIAALAVAGYTLFGRIVREKVSTTIYTYLVYLASACVLCVLVWIEGETLLPNSPNEIFIGFLLAVCSTLLGHSIFSWCLKYFSPAFVSASKLCEPVVAAILACLLFGEYPGALQLIGGCVILSGVLYYQRVEKKEQSESTTHHLKVVGFRPCKNER